MSAQCKRQGFSGDVQLPKERTANRAWLGNVLSSPGRRIFGGDKALVAGKPLVILIASLGVCWPSIKAGTGPSFCYAKPT